MIKRLFQAASLVSIFALATAGIPQASSAASAKGQQTQPSANTSSNSSSTWTGYMPGIDQGPFRRVYHPQNAPSQKDTVGFPTSWTSAYMNRRHNAATPVGQNAPAWLRNGVGWKYPEARAWPLSNDKALADATYGTREALPVQTQFIGNALGVSAVDGVIYAESDDMFVYAINARTGKLIWRTSPLQNALMGYPIVVGNTVYISVGSVSFNFGHVIQYAHTGSTARGEDVSYNGIVALNRTTGAFKWAFMTKGETMPTPAYDNGKLFITSGTGRVYAVNAKTGKEVWEKHVGGVANMSDPIVYDGHVLVNMSVKDYIYSLDENTGKVDWTQTVKGAVNTGLGDVAPAAQNGVLVLSTITDQQNNNGHKTCNTTIQAMNIKTGKILWKADMGRGPLPPAFKGGMPMIHDGVVYVGTPTNSIMQARNLKTGKLLWTWKIPDAGPAGAGRGPATFYKGTLYVSTGSKVFALNPGTGKLIHSKHLGGRFGIVSPTIVGGTMYLGNSWDWVMALPLSEVNPNYKG